MRPQSLDVPQKQHFLISSVDEKRHPLASTEFFEKSCFMQLVTWLRYNNAVILVSIMLLTKRRPGHSTCKSILQYVVFQHIELWNFSLSTKGMLIIDR